MTRSLLCILIAAGALALAGCGASEAPTRSEAPRITVLGGSVAEAVYALGADSLLVARDESSVYPPAVLEKPSVGYFRQLSGEGVLATNPSLVLADPAAGPETALQQIEAAGVEIVRLPGGASPDATVAQLRAVAEVLGREAAGEALADSLQADLARAEALADAAEERPRVLFVLGQGGGTISLSGTGTNADTFIRLAGGANAFAEVEGYKPMTAESVVEAAPDVIFMLGRTAGAVGGVDAFAARPEVAATPAARNGRIVVLPDAALNFGPSLGRFVLDFARVLHSENPPAEEA